MISNLRLPVTQSVASEVQVVWKVIVRDIPAALLPIVLFSLAAFHSSSQPVSHLPIVLMHNVAYAFMYTWTFCLSNQISGVAEDRINKPDRPLVTGELSYRGALIRWLASMMLYTFLGWRLGVLEWVLLWQIVTILHNFARFSRNWIAKNVSMGLGTISQLAAAWQMVTPITPVAWRWIILLAFIIFPLVSLQDLRDMSGDVKTKRITLPLAIGENPARWLLGIGFGLLPVITNYGFFQPAGFSWFSLVAQLALAAFCVLIAIRVVTYRIPEADHHTYMLFCWWYCVLLMVGIVIL